MSALHAGVPERLGEVSSPRRILVVEDDADVAAVLAAGLRSEGHAPSHARTVAEALAWIERCGLPDLALVDIHLPGTSGLEFCRTIQRACDLPIILLTAVSDSEIKAEAIRVFAEDYVVKPFSLNEVLARVDRVLRRRADDVPTALVAGLGDGMTADFYTRTLERSGQRVALTPIEGKLLHILLANEGNTVPMRVLLARVWPQQAATEETLRVHMSRLRSKIGRLEPATPPIETERAVGYRFVRPPG